MLFKNRRYVFLKNTFFDFLPSDEIESNKEGFVARLLDGGFGRVTSQVKNPYYAEQLLFKPGYDAYYTEAEWSGKTHLLADRRSDVGDLRLPRAGRCWTHDGTDDTGTFTSVTFTSSLFYSMWINPVDVSVTQGLLTNRRTHLRIHTSKLLVYPDIDLAPLTGPALTNNQWQWIGFYQTGTTYRIFLDGAQTHTGTTTALDSGTAGNHIGSYISTLFYNGKLRDVRIYVNSAADSAYSNFKNVYSGNWVGSPSLYLPCEEESGYTGFDASGNENHVTLTGITPSTFHATDNTVARSKANEIGYSQNRRLLKNGIDSWTNSYFTFDTSIGVGEEGEIFGVQPKTTSNRWYLGLSETPNVSTAAIDHGIYCNNTVLGVYENGTQRYLGTVADGDQVSIHKSAAGAVTYKKNGTVVYTSALTANTTLSADCFLYDSTTRVYGLDLEITGTPVEYSIDAVGCDLPIIPRREGTSNDVLGNTCQFTGKAPNPGLYLAPVMTGNGTDVYGDLGDFSTFNLQDFDMTVHAVKSSTSSYLQIFSMQYQEGGGDAAGVGVRFDNTNTITVILAEAASTLRSLTSTSTFSTNEAVKIRVYKSGTTFELYINDVLEDSLTVGGTIRYTTTTYAKKTLLLAHMATGSVAGYNNGRIGLVSIESGGTTWHVMPRANTRTLDVLGDDGSASTGSISGGTIANIFANRGDGSWADPRVEHGGYINRYFNGTDSQVDISSTFALTNANLTLACWVYLFGDTDGAFIKIGGASSGFAIGVGGTTYDNTGNDLIGLFETIRWIDTNVAIGTGWHHVAMVIDSAGKPTMYLDGASVYSDASSFGVAPSGAVSYIGGYTSSVPSSRHAECLIKDARVYNVALTSSQISELFAGSEATGATPVGNWLLDDTGSTAVDSQGVNNGTYTSVEKVIVPTKLDDSTYVDDITIDANSVTHVPANSLGDPASAVDRTGGNSNTVFANDSSAPSGESIDTDVKTNTTSKCRARTTNHYKDRLGSATQAQDDMLSDKFYGD